MALAIDIIDAIGIRDTAIQPRDVLRAVKEDIARLIAMDIINGGRYEDIGMKIYHTIFGIRIRWRRHPGIKGPTECKFTIASIDPYIITLDSQAPEEDLVAAMSHIIFVMSDGISEGYGRYRDRINILAIVDMIEGMQLAERQAYTDMWNVLTFNRQPTLTNNSLPIRGQYQVRRDPDL